jgi:hypothetical protein
MRGERSGGGGSGPAQRVFFLIFLKIKFSGEFSPNGEFVFCGFLGGVF